MKKTTTQLREILKKPGLIIAPGCYNAMSAKLIEDAGFEVAYMSGGCTSMAYIGWADVGLITGDEMIQNLRVITERVKIPVIADADTGYGNALNLIRTVKAYIRAGAAAMHVEDQVLPKRCGNLPGKLVVSREEFVGKIKAAKDVINEMDPDFVFIARTDARNAVGGSLEEAIERGNLYVEAGADAVIADGLQSYDELREFCRKVKAPVMIFGEKGVSFSRDRIVTAEDMDNAGVKIWALPSACYNPALYAQIEALKILKTERSLKSIENRLFTVKQLFEIAGLKEYMKMEEKYLPAEDLEKYKKSVGI
jgi:2-methylisocitrate lyase-like PEP mutase family enzyme